MKFLPRCEPIESFGEGGFKFGGMSHRGGLLILPSGMRAWEASWPTDISLYQAVVDEKLAIDVLLIGTGAKTLHAPQLIMQLETQGVMADCMSTSAAIHTYNIMLAENRRVAAALLPVGTPHG